MLLGPLKFSNHQKEVVQFLKTKFPADVFIGSRVPTTRKDKMIIVINGGGTTLEDIRGTNRINLMIWYGNTWESCYDFALDVDSVMRGINDVEHTNIIDCQTVVLPSPTGDGENVNVPVYSCAYDLIIASYNS